MYKIPIAEQAGIKDFLIEFNDERLAQTLAKVISKNLLAPKSFDEAIEMVIQQSSSTSSILNRKAITKSHIFKYMNKRELIVNVDQTKQTMIDSLVSFWTDSLVPRTPSPEPAPSPEPPPSPVQSAHEPQLSLAQHICKLPQQPPPPTNESTWTPTIAIPESVENFPIHQLSRRFSCWFFEQFNASTLKLDDFWTDVGCDIELVDGTVSQQEEKASGCPAVYELLSGLKAKYGFFFNPSVSHTGVQGRIDPHGMVLVLCCGTLHTQTESVGLFECAFGLVRDPFTNNNWKVKHVRMRLKSVGMVSRDVQPELDLRQCDSLQPWLSMSHSANDIDID